MIDRKNKWRMAVKKVGSLSPPRGKYGGLIKFSKLTINRLNGKAIFTRSLGSIGIKKPSSWRNPPNAPPHRNSLRKILKTRMKKFTWSFKSFINLPSWANYVNIRGRSKGCNSPTERILNETVRSYRMETRHYLAEVV